MDQDTKKTEQAPQEATTIGMFLKYTRQNQKKSVEAISKALCIRKVYIKAIEESDFNELPPVPYGIGFVRSYADFLGLNAERIVQCYKEEAMPKKNETNIKPIVKKHTAITMPNRKQILIGISMVLGVYFIALAFNYSNDKQGVLPPTPIEENIPTIVEEISEEPEIVQADTQTTAENTNTTDKNVINVVEENYEEKAPKEVVEKPVSNKVVVKFKGESWIEVKDENTVYINGIYKKGFEYEVPDVPNLIFSVGRYFNVEVYINGELVKVAGPKKQTNIKLDDFLNH